MKHLISLCILSLAVLAGCKKEEAVSAPTPSKPAMPAAAAAAKPESPMGPWMTKAAEGQDIYATFKTNMGDITVKLFSKDAPKTVKNFVGLASGEKDWTNPATGELKKGVPLYNGTIFHRVIENFMIQGGDPLGVGMGGPGYKFEDEFQSGRTFDHKGILAMANAGPGTNGSQFFITTSTPTHLNNHHTIFGEVVKGYEVVDAIQKVPKLPGDKPVQPVTINSIQLSDSAQ